ncbi:MAG TPA: glycogen debranching enzyme GlgX, partial [Achromobacter sp.]|nr:glycogen debranching enzyme GlgX [Achromobacter sp.]
QEVCPGVSAIGWFDTHGGPIDQGAGDDPQQRTMALRRAALREDGSADITLLLMNPGAEPATFTLPEPGQAWLRELDSATQVPAAPVTENEITVQAHSLVLLSATCISGNGS